MFFWGWVEYVNWKYMYILFVVNGKYMLYYIYDKRKKMRRWLSWKAKKGHEASFNAVYATENIIYLINYIYILLEYIA